MTATPAWVLVYEWACPSNNCTMGSEFLWKM